MSDNWWRDNHGLRAEIAREYPAVSAYITELEQDIERYQLCVDDWRLKALDRQAQIRVLEQQLAHKQEQLDQLAHEVLGLDQQIACEQQAVDRLTAELAEANIQIGNLYQGLENRDAERNRLTAQLAEAEAEVERLKHFADCSNCIGKTRQQIIADTRRQVAEECSIMIHNLGCTYYLDSLERTLMVHAADLIRRKYDV